MNILTFVIISIIKLKIYSKSLSLQNGKIVEEKEWTRDLDQMSRTCCLTSVRMIILIGELDLMRRLTKE